MELIVKSDILTQLIKNYATSIGINLTDKDVDVSFKGGRVHSSYAVVSFPDDEVPVLEWEEPPEEEEEETIDVFNEDEDEELEDKEPEENEELELSDSPFGSLVEENEEPQELDVATLQFDPEVEEEDNPFALSDADDTSPFNGMGSAVPGDLVDLFATDDMVEDSSVQIQI